MEGEGICVKARGLFHVRDIITHITFPVYPEQHPGELHHGVSLDLRQRDGVVHVVDELVRGQLQLAQVRVLLLETRVYYVLADDQELSHRTRRFNVSFSPGILHFRDKPIART